MLRGSGYPLHSPISPSLSHPCVTVCHHISTGLYHLSFSTAVVPPLQLWHLYAPVSILSMGDRILCLGGSISCLVAMPLHYTRKYVSVSVALSSSAYFISAVQTDAISCKLTAFTLHTAVVSAGGKCVTHLGKEKQRYTCSKNTCSVGSTLVLYMKLGSLFND